MLRTTAAFAAVLTLAAAPALAQTATAGAMSKDDHMAKDHMAGDAMATKGKPMAMSAADAKACKKMTSAEAMKSPKCHPMADGAMASGSMAKDGMSSGAMSSDSMATKKH